MNKKIEDVKSGDLVTVCGNLFHVTEVEIGTEGVTLEGHEFNPDLDCFSPLLASYTQILGAEIEYNGTYG